MKRIGMTAITLALVAYGTAAMAAESTSDVIRRDAPEGISEAFYACIDRANSSAIEEAYCISEERELQDKRLNTTYQTLLHKVNEGQKKHLVEAERAWLKLQDANTQFEDTVYGREIVDNLQLAENELFAIGRRADQLDQYLAVAGGL